MSNRDQNNEQAPIDSGSERVEALLRRAASFTPEHSAPDDFCAKSLAKLESKSKASVGMKLNPFGAFAIGGATFALASVTFAIALSGHRQATPATIAVVGPKVHPATFDAVSSAASTSKLTETDQIPATIIHSESAPRPRPRPSYATRFARLASFRRGSRAKHQIRTPPGDWPARPVQIAQRSEKPAMPAQSCWTTEDVQETNYVVVSAGIVTDGTGDSERATPVLVQLPISGDYESSDGDDSVPDANSEKH